MQQIQVRNTLSGKKEKLQTQEPGHVKIYACGVTVYDDCHIGHAMQAVYFDVIRNYLEHAGYKVTYVRNYTDVDDKIIDKAKRLGISPRKLADDVIASTQRDMESLGLRPATHEPKVSESIPEIIAMIEELVKNDSAYPSKNGDVYYRVRSKADYGKLSNRKPDDMRCGTRELAGEKKENEPQEETPKEDELDFALWKHDTTIDASWDSPWGKGRPGWHIECSAMAKEYLGDSFDIHGGGRDLIFPHHENEIAQSESANHCAYASYWLHSGLMTIDKQKMSKSLGNHITIADFVKQWPAEVLKLAFFERHYRSNIDFSEKVFQETRCRLLFFYETLTNLNEIADKDDAIFKSEKFQDGYKPTDTWNKFHAAMNDDFNTAQALAELGSLFKFANQLIKKKNTALRNTTAYALYQQIKEIGAIFGLFSKDSVQFIHELKQQVLPELGITSAEIEKFITDRKQARTDKNWQLSDSIRDQLLAKGIELRDGNESTSWTIAR